MQNLKVNNFTWRLRPDYFAEAISKGLWLPYPHLTFIAKKITEAISKGGARLIIEAPPRHGKSEFISNYLPAWFLEICKNKSVILASYEAEFASTWGRKVRNIFEENSMLSAKLRDDSSAANRFHLSNGCAMITAGVGGPITGRGGDLIIIDDPVKNSQDALSATKRRSAIDWFQSTLYTRCEPGASIIVLQTRWHEGDLAGWLQNEHTDPWEVIRLPAMAEEGDVLGRKVGEPLCPERYDSKALDQIKSGMSSYWFNALYQQRPSPDEGSIIKKQWLRYWDQLPEKFDRKGQFWDLAFKGNDSSDYVVGALWGKKGPDFYLLDRVRARMNFPQTISAMRQFTAKHPDAYEKVIEDKANGPAVIDTLRHETSGIIAFNPEGSKEARLHSCAVLFEAGNVFVPDPQFYPWVKEYIDELITFPNAQNDDQVDVTTMPLIRWRDGAGPKIHIL
jgi:predicted phage terminase large subunit-like protein